MQLERVEGNKAIYKEKGKTITVIREYPKETDMNFSAVLDVLLNIVEQEEMQSKDISTNEE